MNSKKICPKHQIAHLSQEVCPYCAPTAGMGVSQLRTEHESANRQERLNLVNTYLNLMTAMVGRAAGTLELANKIGKKLGYPPVKEGMSATEALAPAVTELERLLSL